jgi:hypothetical protein
MDEKPIYSEINVEEMRDLEREFGRPLTKDLALWLIRFKTNRDAIQRMIGEEDEDDESPEKHGTKADTAKIAASGR